MTSASYKFIHRLLELMLNGKFVAEDDKRTRTIIPPSKTSAESAYNSITTQSNDRSR